MGIHDREYYREETIDLQPSWNGKTAVSYLLIINSVIFVADMLSNNTGLGSLGIIGKFLALKASYSVDPWQWWHTLSYAFVHDGAMHLIFNMMGLYFLGRSVEDKYGRREFTTIYLVCAVFCGAIWLLKHWMLSSGPLIGSVVGASGAVICIEMLFVLNFPTRIIMFFVFPMPAWVLGVIIVLMNLVNQPAGKVAVDVHITGILFAAGYFFLGLNFTRIVDVVGTWKRLKRRVFGPRLRVHSEMDSESLDAQEADRILAKIHDKGKDSLSSRERKFMEKYSRSVRERKRSE